MLLHYQILLLIGTDIEVRVGEMGCGEVAEGCVKWRALVWFYVCTVLRMVDRSLGCWELLILAAAQ
jgi:hypothetical protein